MTKHVLKYGVKLYKRTCTTMYVPNNHAILMIYRIYDGFGNDDQCFPL